MPSKVWQCWNRLWTTSQHPRKILYTNTGHKSLHNWTISLYGEKTSRRKHCPAPWPIGGCYRGRIKKRKLSLIRTGSEFLLLVLFPFVDLNALPRTKDNIRLSQVRFETSSGAPQVYYLLWCAASSCAGLVFWLYPRIVECRVWSVPVT